MKGRNFITWEEIFAYDLEYVNHCTFWMDLRILLLTVYKFVARKDISDATDGTMDSTGRTVHDSLDRERSPKV